MVSRFVGGVRDVQGQRGYVEANPGEVLAIDLVSGAVLWRRERIGRPIAATAERLIALDREGDRYVLRLVEAVSGGDAGRIDDFGMPHWAAKTGLTQDSVEVEASEVPDGIRLDWNLRQLYRGGAPPPEHIATETRGAVRGATIVNPNAARSIPAAPTSPGPPKPSPFAAEATSDPSVFAHDRVGDRVFALKAEGSSLVLEARDARTGGVVWQTALAERHASRPTPLRK